jgi:hypothetical protein
MTTPVTTETELRHAVIDRLIAASMRDVTPAREAEMKTWRTISTKNVRVIPGTPAEPTSI